MNKKVLRFKNMIMGRQNGELARLRVIGGPDTGSVFIIKEVPVSLGRAEESEIFLSDLQISRKHAEIFTDHAGRFIVRDLDSAHGILVNGQSQKSSMLKSSDKIGIGKTVLEFIGAESGAQHLVSRSPVKTAQSVGTGTSGLTQFISKGSPSMPSASTKPKTFLERNKKFILVLALLTGFATILPEVEQREKKKKVQYIDPKDIEIDRKISSLDLPPVEDAIFAKSNQYFKSGFREYRTKNYLRAKSNFETALQIFPDHPLALTYLQSTVKGMEDEADLLLKSAKRNLESNRQISAVQDYEKVLRLFSKEQKNPKYIEAKQRFEELQAESKKEKF